jgi:ABC-2 type transport system ATP-binding protein
MNAFPLLQAKDLSHMYGSFQVLAPLDLTLKAGEISVLHGPNGSGKTTLLLCLAGLLQPTSGEILVEGQPFLMDEPATRRALAFVPDVPRFYMELTAWEHLLFIASAHTAMEGFKPRAETLLKEFGLWEARNLFPHHYSRGMSLKLGLLLALIRPFKLLLMDEPLSALDPDSTQQFLRRLKSLRQQGASILLSTHSLEPLTNLADHSYRLDNGVLSTV